ncbi:DUF4394 domain-containing protein [Segetibacter sp. 3557_3]|uniref:DUF4394 domain-containing protein n=1 Tax=Segetibacter sp. 3557_3 TaxID=2547429 RepID=UPI001058BEAC|nr:DUF4394 domain-containing protein [Segetibacter sp. 3557_3]TDH18420.1 DUF4394 domain-containing protein [Segetibacter sp. 3557_3]
MKKYFSRLFLLAAMGSSMLFTSCEKTDTSNPVLKPDMMFYGLSNANQLIRYNANASQTAMSTTAITGLAGSEKIVGIDFRPATGQLFGVSSGSRLYVINPETGAATAVGTAAFTPALNGNLVGFDFNPTVDRIRLVTSSGQNLRLNPETGGVAATDAALNPGAPAVMAAAYTNSMAGATTTTLYDIDIVSGKLYKQDPPNNGTLVEVGSLGMTSEAGKDGGFDISPDNSVALASFGMGTDAGLYQVDLSTGKATDLGKLSTAIIGLAIPSAPVAYAIDNANNLQIFNFLSSTAPVSKPITGLQSGENILGVDMRPATGQLFALGSTSRLYTLNTSTGAATVVGTAPFAPQLAGTTFGFDFNPTVDRIRLVSNTGQNLRLNPVDGTTSAIDGGLNPGMPAVSGAAYTNNFAGATTTVLFDIDATTDKLYTQAPPNNGTLVEVGNLGAEITAENGFDIGGTSGKAYALLTVAGSTRLYSVNLTSGAATMLMNYPNATRGLAIGLGF